jgi:dienelactone hydrolase
VAVNHAGWRNALEASLPAGWLPRTFKVGLVAGKLDASGGVAPANVAYRRAEPAAGVYNDQRQALALHAGTVDEFGTSLDLRALRAGATQRVRPGPGYAERHMRSGINISTEGGENGIWQPYGLYVPTSYDPSKRTPLTFWLHYRGGKAHSGAAWTPRLMTQLGEEAGNIVATPRGRGTSTWYVSESHQDFFEVFDDVHRLLTIDPNRRYLSGYSMGGYGTYLFGLLYPGLFAAGYSTSGAPTQGAWTGEGPDDCATGACFVEANGGDADAQLTYRILENAQNFPLVIHHGSNDELVPVTGIQRIGARLAELGYRYDLTTFIGYEHFTQAIVDEWADGAAYLNSFKRERNPRRVTYKVVPALVNAVNTVTADGVSFNFNPDGAYWVDGLRVRAGDPADPSVSGQISAASSFIPADDWIPLPRTGAVSPLGHSTPFVRHGLDWLPVGKKMTGSGFNATLTNLSRAVLDIERMNVNTRKEATGVITSDGPTTLILRSIDRPVRVFLDDRLVGTTDGRIALNIPEGESRVRLRPANR